MPFKRNWDISCPRIYSQWEGDGFNWTIQDIRPEDDEEAIKMLMEYFVPDEVLCSTIGVSDEPKSMEAGAKFWRRSLAQRTSLGCYREKNGVKRLVGLNVTPVTCSDDSDYPEIKGKLWGQTTTVLNHTKQLYNTFKEMKVDKYLSGAGLVVLRECRGYRLGAKLLDAREPLCRHLKITVTETLFTGTASQKLAERCGFETVALLPLKDLHKLGLDYSKDDERVMKLMVKKYDWTENGN